MNHDSKMRLLSPVFEEGGQIPKIYTCQGKDINPPLKFENVPKEAQTLVLIMEDPDVPTDLRADGMYDHWIIYNIPARVSEIKENSSPNGQLGKNTSGKTGYMGPCPPDREHRYFFTLYALDDTLELPEEPTKCQVIEAMQGFILAEAQLMGRYQKS